MIRSSEPQTKMIANKGDYSQLNFTNVSLFIDSLYSLTGTFETWNLLGSSENLYEYGSEGSLAGLVLYRDSVVCCKFYKMVPGLLSLPVVSPYKCKAIYGGIVVEK